METLLILGGLLLILAGYVWFVMLAFGRSLLWGIASLFPPLALVFLLRHWGLVRKAVVFGALGWIPLVVGLALMASHDSSRLEALFSLKWLRPEPPPQPELAISLRGEFRGAPFAPEQAELIDGVLSLREGQDFYARREIQVRLPQPPDGPLRLDVLPDDPGARPEIEISWLESEQGLPEARRLNRGYSLHLELLPEPPNRMRGVFHLVLPAEYRTTLSGQIELYTDRLRYKDGQVDTHFDSQDTLAWVLRDYLQRRFASREVELSPLPRLDTRRNELSVPLGFRVAGQPDWLRLELYRSAQKGWAVRDDHFPKLREDVAPAQASVVAEQQPEVVAAAPAPVQQGPLALEQLRAAPQQFQNRRMRVITQRGSTAEGVFTGLDSEGQIVIRRIISGPGQASFVLHPADVMSIELLAP